MPRIVVLYKLKTGATMKAYKQFSKEIDQVITPKQKVVQKFEVFEVSQFAKGGSSPSKEKPPYEVFEVIDVDNFDEWIKTTESPGFKKVVDEWNKLGDGETLLILSGQKI
jgi:hypothetical protein